MSSSIALGADARVLVVGYGLHGRAVTQALLAKGHEVVVVDDSPSPETFEAAAAQNLEIVVSPDEAELASLTAEVSHVVPTPGLADRHPVFDSARMAGLPIVSEFDLATQWDDRPVVAITGTNGKTTVTTLVTQILNRSGKVAAMAGNMELPLVTAIEDEDADLFVVEASSFRLGHSSLFSPRVATWLNFAPDHLDVHASLAAYEQSKARIWANQTSTSVAIANNEDPVVMRNLPGHGTELTFGTAEGDAYCGADQLVVNGKSVAAVGDLPRALPHDLSNALAASVTAVSAGATTDAIGDVLREFRGLAHRMQLVARARGVSWFNDSKATTPHAVVAGVAGLDSAVLIAGGRNKGVDLSPLADLSPSLRAVVAIGEAADEVMAVFAGRVETSVAGSMRDAVCLAAQLARPEDSVVLSPGCTSYDWYRDYAARGDDFARLVEGLPGADSGSSH